MAESHPDDKYRKNFIANDCKKLIFILKLVD